MESRNVTFIETTPHLLLPTSKLSPLQDLVPTSWDLDDEILDNTHILYDDLLRDIRDYTCALDFTANISAYHENASGMSADLQEQGLVDQIRDLTRRDLLMPAAPLPGAASPAEHLSRATWDLGQGEHHSRVEEERRSKQGNFCRPHAGYSAKGNRYAQQQDFSVQLRHPACCRGADRRGYQR